MIIKTLEWPFRLLAFALVTVVAIGCGDSEKMGLTLDDIPLYPGADEGQAMAQSGPFGILGGALQQFTTTDSYDEVMEFYTRALSGFKPEFLSHESRLGRQTGISVPRKDGMITVAVQEFTAEGKVNITFMSVGK